MGSLRPKQFIYGCKLFRYGHFFTAYSAQVHYTSKPHGMGWK